MTLFAFFGPIVIVALMIWMFMPDQPRGGKKG